MKKELKFGKIDIYSKDNKLNTYSVRLTTEYNRYYDIKYHKHLEGTDLIYKKLKLIPKTEIIGSRYSVIRDIYTKKLNLFMRFLVYIGLKKY